MSVLQDGLIHDILEDTKHNLWIATNKGLVKIEPNDNCRLFTEKDGLPSGDISCVFQDKEENIWIGSSLGLGKLATKNDIRIYTTEDGLASKSNSALYRLTKNLFFVSNGDGVQLYNSATGRFISVPPKDNNSYYGFVQNSDPVLFFGYHNVIGKYDSVSHSIVTEQAPVFSNSIVYCSIIDSSGIIFSGTQTGLLVCYKGRSWFEKSFTHRITSMLIDKKGDLWIGTWDNGLYRLHYKRSQNRPDHNLINFSVQDFSNLLPDKSIRCLFEDRRGSIWVGTRYGGLVQLAKNAADGNQPLTAQQFNLTQGLMSNFVRSIAEDNKGCIWIGSDLGIDKLLPAASTFHIFNFSRINNYFAPVNAILVSNSSLWFATSNGISHIVDGEMEKSTCSRRFILLPLL